MPEEPFRVEPFPAMRRFSLDAGRLGRGKHIVHGLLEVDVTEARRRLRAHKAATGERLSFTGWVVACLGQALDRHPHVHAYLDWRRRLVIYERVNVVLMIEAEMDGRRVPMPFVVQAVNHKSVRDIHDEIRAVQHAPRQSAGGRYMRWFLYLPWFVRRLFYAAVTRFPQTFRDLNSSVLLTAVGMFGRGGGYAITMPNHTLTVALGGIARRPGYNGDRVEPREYLNVTLSINHDVVDGAPAARFGQAFRQLLEEAYGLEAAPPP